MQIEQALSGLSYTLFFMVMSFLMIAVTVLLLGGLLLLFITTARILLVSLRRNLAAFSAAISGRLPRAAKVVSVVSRGKKCA